MAEPASFKYRAFLSYAHADTRWAKWLHRQLEGFRLDKDLIGRKTSLGPVPKTLRPVFRDREDFPGGHTLTEATITALDASAALIVLCSPVAAGRPAVNEEVRLFRARHPARPLIPVIIEGKYPDNFPLALRFELAPDGTLTDCPVTILGPDLRDDADGKSLSLAKVVAGLTGLGADEIFRRAERTRRRQNRFWAGLAGVFFLLAVAAAGSALYAWQQLKTNEAFLSATLRTATEIVTTAAAQAEKYNVPRAATLELLTKAEALFEHMARYGRPTPELQYQRAWMLIQFARSYAVLSDTGKQLERATEAYRLLAGLAAQKPADTTYQRDLGVAYSEVGDVLVVQGNLPEALKSFRDGLIIFERLAQSDPGASRQRDLSFSYKRIGEVLVAQGDLQDALKFFRDSLAIFERLAQSDPGNAGWQRNLAVSYIEIGDVLVAQGSLPEALRSFRADLAITERLAQSDSGNADWQRELSVSYERIGNVLVAQGNLPEALKSFRDSFAIIKRLAQSDPGNADWQRDLSVLNEHLGDVYLAQGNLSAAIEQYRASLDRMIPIRDADPSNMYLQHFTSVTYDKIGHVLVAQSNLQEALKSFRADLAIMERLAQSDPGNAGWQRDLSVSYGNIGGVLEAQGNLPEALKSFRGGLAIFERLAQSDPGNAGWQRDLSLSYNKIGDVLVAQGNLPEALKSFRDSLAIRERLVQSDPGNVGWQSDLSVSYERIGDVLVAQGHLPEALKSFRDSLSIREHLVQSDPGNADWQRDLVISCVKLAETDPSQARAFLTRASEIVQQMQRRGQLAPRDGEWPADLKQRIESLPK
jgi:tetratricopeptide (TPR) repeat protein